MKKTIFLIHFLYSKSYQLFLKSFIYFKKLKGTFFFVSIVFSMVCFYFAKHAPFFAQSKLGINVLQKEILLQLANTVITVILVTWFFALTDIRSQLSSIFNEVFYKGEFLADQKENYKNEISKKLVVSKLEHLHKIDSQLFDKFNSIRRHTFSKYFIENKVIEIGLYEDNKCDNLEGLISDDYFIYDYCEKFLLKTLDVEENILFGHTHNVVINSSDFTIFMDNIDKFIIEFSIKVDNETIHIFDYNIEREENRIEKEKFEKTGNKFKKSVFEKNYQLELLIAFQKNKNQKPSVNFSLKSVMANSKTKTEFYFEISYKIRQHKDDLNYHFRMRHPTKGFVLTFGSITKEIKYDYQAIWYKFWKSSDIESVDSFVQNKGEDQQDLTISTYEWLIPGEGVVLTLNQTLR